MSNRRKPDTGKFKDHLTKLTKPYIDSPNMNVTMTSYEQEGCISVEVGDSHASSTRKFYARVYRFNSLEQMIQIVHEEASTRTLIEVS